jgi:hypothetical protein
VTVLAVRWYLLELLLSVGTLYEKMVGTIVVNNPNRLVIDTNRASRYIA